MSKYVQITNLPLHINFIYGLCGLLDSLIAILSLGVLVSDFQLEFIFWHALNDHKKKQEK